jgi:hypothetical protein
MYGLGNETGYVRGAILTVAIHDKNGIKSLAAVGLDQSSGNCALMAQVARKRNDLDIADPAKRLKRKADSRWLVRAVVDCKKRKVNIAR